MSQHLKAPTDRRRFLDAAVRTLALCGLGAFWVWQDRKRRRLAEDPACIRLYDCSDCLEFSRCDKAKARVARQTLRSDVS